MKLVSVEKSTRLQHEVLMLFENETISSLIKRTPAGDIDEQNTEYIVAGTKSLNTNDDNDNDKPRGLFDSE